jgi:hypothetical protein
MATLHIEHSITSFDVWRAAFDRFAGVRQQSGVRRERVRRPVDDPNYVIVDLDFDTARAAQTFLDFLQANVWASPENAPALVGHAQAKILEVVDSGRTT